MTLLSSELHPEFAEEGGVRSTFLLRVFDFFVVLRVPFFRNFVKVLEDEDREAEGEEGPVWKALCGCGLPCRSQCSLSNLCNLFASDSEGGLSSPESVPATVVTLLACWEADPFFELFFFCVSA